MRLPSFVWRAGLVKMRARPSLAIAAVLCAIATAPGAADTSEPLAIAIAAPLSGPRAALGRAVQAGARHAADQANAASTSGRQIRLVIIDDGCTAESAIANATEIIATKPFAVAGHPCANAAAAAAPLYAKAGIAFIATGVTHPRLGLTKTAPLTLRIPAGETPVGTFIGEHLAALPADARIGLARDRTLLARGIIQDVFKELARRGRTATIVDSFAGGDKDYTALVGRLKAADITHLALAAFPNEGALLTAEAKAAMPELAIITTDLLADPEAARIAGIHAEGVLVAMATDLARTADARRSVALFNATSPTLSRVETNAALATHAAVEILARAALASASEAPADLASSIAGASHATVIGQLTFDNRREAKLPSWTLYAWRNGALVAVAP